MLNKGGVNDITFQTLWGKCQIQTGGYEISFLSYC